MPPNATPLAHPRSAHPTPTSPLRQPSLGTERATRDYLIDAVTGALTPQAPLQIGGHAGSVPARMRARDRRRVAA